MFTTVFVSVTASSRIVHVLTETPNLPQRAACGLNTTAAVRETFPLSALRPGFILPVVRAGRAQSFVVCRSCRHASPFLVKIIDEKIVERERAELARLLVKYAPELASSLPLNRLTAAQPVG